MNKRTVLVVEDDAAIRRGLVDALRFAGYQPLEAATGEAGLSMATRMSYDLLLLDLVLPGLDGLEILREVRGLRPTMPILILTARGGDADRVRGLRMGADDYIVKPFSVSELLARVEAVLRRSPERPLDISEVTIPKGVADVERREVRFHDGCRCELTDREAELLRYLACNPRRLITRQEILARVWRVEPHGIDTRTIDMHISRLREKLRDDPSGPQLIRTTWGKGYCFVPPGSDR